MWMQMSLFMNWSSEVWKIGSGAPYLSVLSNTDENGKAVTLKAECDLNGFYISVFRQPDGTDDWQGVLIGETISQEGTTFAVPDGEKRKTADLYVPGRKRGKTGS